MTSAANEGATVAVLGFLDTGRRGGIGNVELELLLFIGCGGGGGGVAVSLDLNAVGAGTIKLDVVVTCSGFAGKLGFLVLFAAEAGC
jgi:hypothetical protein